jgi:hypothetical protein
MGEGEIRMQAQMYALVADMAAITTEVDGMKAANTEREAQGFALAYDEAAFSQAAKDLAALAEQLRAL